MRHFLLLFLGILISGTVTAQQLKVNPKVGVNISRVTSDVPNISPDGAKAGFQLGVDVRMGDYDRWFFFQPGIHYYDAGARLSVTDDTQVNVTGDVSVRSIKIPLNGGIYLTGNDGILRVRANAGFVPTVVFGVGDSNLNTNDTNFRTFGLGANVGVGIDLTLLTLDLGYEYGLGRIYESGNGRNNLLTLSVGIVIPPSF